jgi:5-methylcytosine-specific restriction endonuclease McrA
VLTVAHLDHAPEHNDPANLRALCQRCHLAHDREQHRTTAYHTRRTGKALGDLFDAHV